VQGRLVRPTREELVRILGQSVRFAKSQTAGHIEAGLDPRSMAHTYPVFALPDPLRPDPGRHALSAVSDLIVSIDCSEVRNGKLEDLRLGMKALVDFVEANEMRPLSYEVFFSDDGTRMTVLQVHPDSASMEFHMSVAGAQFAKVRDLLTLSAIDIYGTASEALLDQMRQKAQLLGGAALAVHDLHAGFTRFGLD
jgi:hypothetical protein